MIRYACTSLRETAILQFVVVLIVLWLLFASALYAAEQYAAEPTIRTFGEALYWGVAAFSTAGIADTPSTPLALLIGGIWIVTGSAIFFGIIVATITGYFMKPMHRPVQRLVDTIEYNLEHLAELTVEELDLLKATTDSLIAHMEKIKHRETSEAE